MGNVNAPPPKDKIIEKICRRIKSKNMKYSHCMDHIYIYMYCHITHILYMLSIN